MFDRIIRQSFAGLITLSLMVPALAKPKLDELPDTPGQGAAKTNSLEPQVPHCDRSYGTVAINEPDNHWWTQFQLGSPTALIKVIVTRSACFRVVNRGTGLAMRNQERDLGGELQRGSNVGAGQIKSADFFLVPDLIGSNGNAGGKAIGGGLGGLAPGIFGAVLGGIRTKKLTARTVLTLVNARTTEEVAAAEGQAQKSDVSFGLGGGGFGGGIGGAVVGGGYTDTEIGRIISAAYVTAYGDLVRQVQANAPSSQAPKKAYRVQVTTAMMNRPGGKVMKMLHAGDQVFPTGERSGVFLKVADEFDIEGWVHTSDIKG